MAIAAATTLLSLIALSTLAGCFWLWLIAIARAAGTYQLPSPAAAQTLVQWLRRKGYPPALPLVSWISRPPVPWAVLDFLLLAGVWLLATLAINAAFRLLGWNLAGAEIDELSLAQRRTVLAGNIVVSLSIVALGLPLVALRTGSGPRDFGLRLDTLWDDLKLGVLGFVMLAPPVYALQGILVTIWKPSKHPLMEMFKGAPDPSFFALLFLSAAIVAPLFEELVFRVFLQGLLEKAVSFAYSLPELLVGAWAQEPRDADGPVIASFNTPPATSESTLPTVNPYAPPLESSVWYTREQAGRDQPELRGISAWLAIGISSSIFALLHYSHGPDWIPLLFLAAGMGYLYQRTHRLLPSLTVHALLNAVSLLALWVQVKTTG